LNSRFTTPPLALREGGSNDEDQKSVSRKLDGQTIPTCLRDRNQRPLKFKEIRKKKSIESYLQDPSSWIPRGNTSDGLHYSMTAAVSTPAPARTYRPSPEWRTARYWRGRHLKAQCHQNLPGCIQTIDLGCRTLIATYNPIVISGWGSSAQPLPIRALWRGPPHPAFSRLRNWQDLRSVAPTPFSLEDGGPWQPSARVQK